MDKYALEIKTEQDYDLAAAIVPGLRWIGFEALHLHFLVFDAETGEHETYGPGAVAQTFDHIENSHTIMVKKMIGK